MFATVDEIEAFIDAFESLTLHKVQWTHHAHLVVALWYLTHHLHDDALDFVRRRIRAYNEAVGTANTDTGGYHETLTRLYLRGVPPRISWIIAGNRFRFPLQLCCSRHSPAS